MSLAVKVVQTIRPPAPGDTYEDSDFGIVKLLKPSGGDSWCCKTANGTRLYLRPKLMKRIPDDAK